MVLLQVIIDAQDTVQYFRWPMAPGKYRARILHVECVTDKTAHGDDLTFTIECSQMAVYQLRPGGATSTTALRFPVTSDHGGYESGATLDFDLFINGAQMDWKVSLSTPVAAGDFNSTILDLDVEPYIL